MRLPLARPSAELLPEPAPLTVGTAGHVDHGKTALIEALTGTNTDRLEEERRRGLSIELGFAQLTLPDARPLSIVDVPGHERFIRTMVAGVTGIDLYLLAVAADDGVMPQTREHLAVLRALGINHGVIALTKCDLVDGERERAVVDQLAALLPGTRVIPTSTRDRTGLDELKQALAETAAIAGIRPVGDEWREPALHIDRVFSLQGIGTVVTGTLRYGAIAAGEVVRVLPQGRRGRIRSIHVHNQPVARAEPRQRVAINLAAIERTAIERGAVVVASNQQWGLRPSYRVDVELILEHRLGDLHGTRVQAHHGTREAPARVVRLDEQGRFAQLRLEEPFIARPGEMVVLRTIAPPATIGGAEVVDPAPPRHGRGTHTDELLLLREGTPTELVGAAVARERRIPTDPDQWHRVPLLALARHRYSREDWIRAQQQLVNQGTVAVDDGFVVRPSAGGATARPALPGVEITASDRALAAALQSDGTQPRSRAALADATGFTRREVERSLQRLCGAGILVRTGPDVFYAAEEYRRLASRLMALLHERGGSLSLAETRDALRTTRKYAQALLEHFDGRGLTVRRGERHYVRTRSIGRQGSGGPAGLQSQ